MDKQSASTGHQGRRQRQAPVWAGLLASLALAGCSHSGEQHSAEFFVFGTTVEVKARDVSRDHAENAFAGLGRMFRRLHREWHPWQPGALAELNAGLADGGWVTTTTGLAKLARASRRFEKESLGRFNPAIGALVELWGFHTSDYPITEPPPTDSAIAAALNPYPSMKSVSVDGQRVKADHAGVQFDFSGIAKGLAGRKACDQLARVEIFNAMVNLGGDVVVCGPTTQPWRVAIRNPDGGILTRVDVTRPTAVFTSGNYYRYKQFDGKRYAHILDPFTGQPVDQIMQATVIDTNPLRADAAATALVVAGPEQWRLIAERMHIKRALVVDADGAVHTLGIDVGTRGSGAGD